MATWCKRNDVADIFSVGADRNYQAELIFRRLNGTISQLCEANQAWAGCRCTRTVYTSYPLKITATSIDDCTRKGWWISLVSGMTFANCLSGTWSSNDVTRIWSSPDDHRFVGNLPPLLAPFSPSFVTVRPLKLLSKSLSAGGKQIAFQILRRTNREASNGMERRIRRLAAEIAIAFRKTLTPMRKNFSSALLDRENFLFSIAFASC